MTDSNTDPHVQSTLRVLDEDIFGFDVKDELIKDEDDLKNDFVIFQFGVEEINEELNDALRHEHQGSRGIGANGADQDHDF